MKRTYLLAILISFFIIFSFYSYPDSSNPSKLASIINHGFRYSDTASSEPLIISSDTDFALHGFNGSGNAGDPYVIEDLRIQALDGSCISVSNTRAHFTIRNCTLESSPTSTVKGLRLVNVTNAVVNGCTIINNRFGLYLTEVQNSAFDEISIMNNRFGALLRFCSNNSFTQLNLTQNLDYGLHAETILDNEISNCLILSNLGVGLQLGYGCEDNRIFNNEIGWNSAGNAEDNGFGNMWEYSGTGNRWSGYIGVGGYAIPGVAKSIDGSPGFILTVNHPSDIVFDPQQSTQNSITWICQSIRQVTYFILDDNNAIFTGTLNESLIQIPINETEYGVYNYTLVLNDIFDIHVADTILVFVQDLVPPVIDSPTFRNPFVPPSKNPSSTVLF